MCKDPAEKLQVRFGQDEISLKVYAMNAKAWKVDAIQPELDATSNIHWNLEAVLFFP